MYNNKRQSNRIRNVFYGLKSQSHWNSPALTNSPSCAITINDSSHSDCDSVIVLEEEDISTAPEFSTISTLTTGSNNINDVILLEDSGLVNVAQSIENKRNQNILTTSCQSDIENLLSLSSDSLEDCFAAKRRRPNELLPSPISPLIDNCISSNILSHLTHDVSYIDQEVSPDSENLQVQSQRLEESSGFASQFTDPSLVENFRCRTVNSQMRGGFTKVLDSSSDLSMDGGGEEFLSGPGAEMGGIFWGCRATSTPTETGCSNFDLSFISSISGEGRGVDDCIQSDDDIDDDVDAV